MGSENRKHKRQPLKNTDPPTVDAKALESLAKGFSRKYPVATSLGGLVLVAFLIWPVLAYVWQQIHGKGSLSAAELGDAFSPLVGFVTALGLLLTAYALVLQRRQLGLQIRELRAMQRELRLQVDQATASREALEVQQKLMLDQLEESRNQRRMAFRGEQRLMVERHRSTLVALKTVAEDYQVEFEALAAAKTGRPTEVVGLNRFLDSIGDELRECDKAFADIQNGLHDEGHTGVLSPSSRTVLALERQWEQLRQSLFRFKQRRTLQIERAEELDRLLAQVMEAKASLPSQVADELSIERSQLSERADRVRRQVAGLVSSARSYGNVDGMGVENLKNEIELLRTDTRTFNDLCAQWERFESERRALITEAARLTSLIKRHADRVAIVFDNSIRRSGLLVRYLREQSHCMSDADKVSAEIGSFTWRDYSNGRRELPFADLARVQGRQESLVEMWTDVKEKVYRGDVA